jgi:hypothetical protein
MSHSSFVDDAIRQYEPLLSENSRCAVERAVTSALEGHAGSLQAMCANAHLPYPSTLGVIWALACGNFALMTPAERARVHDEAVVALAPYDATNPNNNLACTAS